MPLPGYPRTVRSRACPVRLGDWHGEQARSAWRWRHGTSGAVFRPGTAKPFSSRRGNMGRRLPSVRSSTGAGAAG